MLLFLFFFIYSEVHDKHRVGSSPKAADPTHFISRLRLAHKVLFVGVECLRLLSDRSMKHTSPFLALRNNLVGGLGVDFKDVGPLAIGFFFEGDLDLLGGVADSFLKIVISFII